MIAGVSGNAGVLCVAEAEGEYAAGHRAAAVGLMLVREDEAGTVVTLGTRPGNVVYADSDSLNYEAPFSGAIYSVTVYAWRYGVGGGVSLEREAAIGAPLVSDLDLTATVDFDSGSPGVARVVLRTHPGGEFDGNRDVVVGFAPLHVGATVSLTIKFRSGAVASWGGGGTEVFGEGDSFATTDGSGRTLTATYHGRRRGLHVMALEGFHSAGTGADVCPAAANGETGWRLPNFTELAGLYAEGGDVELGEAFGVLAFGTAGAIAGLRGGMRISLGAGPGDAAALTELAYADAFDREGRVGVALSGGRLDAARSLAGARHYCVAETERYVETPPPFGVWADLGDGRVTAGAGDSALTVSGGGYVNARAVAATLLFEAWRWDENKVAVSGDADLFFAYETSGEFGAVSAGEWLGGSVTILISATVAAEEVGGQLGTLRVWPRVGATATVLVSVALDEVLIPLTLDFYAPTVELAAAADYVGPLFTLSVSWPADAEERPDSYDYILPSAPENVFAREVSDSVNVGNVFGEVYAGGGGLSGGVLTVFYESVANRERRGTASDSGAATIRVLARRPVVSHPLVTSGLGALRFETTLAVLDSEHSGFSFSYEDASGEGAELRAFALADGSGATIGAVDAAATLGGGARTIVAHASAAGVLGTVKFTVEVTLVSPVTMFGGRPVYLPGDVVTASGFAAEYHGFRRGAHYVASAADEGGASELGAFCAAGGEGWRPASVAEFAGLFAGGSRVTLGAIPEKVVSPGLEEGFVLTLAPLGVGDAGPPSFARGFPNAFLPNVDVFNGALLATDDFRVLNNASGSSDFGGRLVCVGTSAAASHSPMASILEVPQGRSNLAPVSPVRILGKDDDTIGLGVAAGAVVIPAGAEAPLWDGEARARSEQTLEIRLESARANLFTLRVDESLPGLANVVVERVADPADDALTVRATVAARARRLFTANTLWGPWTRHVFEYRFAADILFGSERVTRGIPFFQSVVEESTNTTRTARLIYGGVRRGLHFVYSAHNIYGGGVPRQHRRVRELCESRGWRLGNVAEVAGLYAPSHLTSATLRAELKPRNLVTPGVHNERREEAATVIVSFPAAGADDDAAAPGPVDAYTDERGNYIFGDLYLAVARDGDLVFANNERVFSGVMCVLPEEEGEYAAPFKIAGVRLLNQATGAELSRSDNHAARTVTMTVTGSRASLRAVAYNLDGDLPEQAPKLTEFSGSAADHYAIRTSAGEGGFDIRLESIGDARAATLGLALAPGGNATVRFTVALEPSAPVAKDVVFGGVGLNREEQTTASARRFGTGESASFAMRYRGELMGLHFVEQRDYTEVSGYAGPICRGAANGEFRWRVPRLAELAAAFYSTRGLEHPRDRMAGWDPALSIPKVHTNVNFAFYLSFPRTPSHPVWLDNYNEAGEEMQWDPDLDGSHSNALVFAGRSRGQIVCVAESERYLEDAPELVGTGAIPLGVVQAEDGRVEVAGNRGELLTLVSGSWRWNRFGERALYGGQSATITIEGHDAGSANVKTLEFPNGDGSSRVGTITMHYGANGRLTLAWDSPGMLEGETATLTLGASSPVFGAGYDYEVVLFGAERRVPSPEFFAVASPRWVVAPGWTGTLVFSARRRAGVILY